MSANITFLSNSSAKSHKIKKNEVALASFPRSGSTWVRNILMNLALSKDKLSVPIDFGTVEKIIPYDKIYKEFNLSLIKLKSFPVIIKTNDLCKNPGRAVYIIRDPRDTLVSFFYFEKYYLKRIGNDISISEYVRKKIDTWCRHVKSWQRHWGPLVVYEELHRRPEKEVKKILDYLKISASEKEVANAINKSTFREMQKMEKSFQKKIDPKNFKKKKNPEYFIVRKGKVGQWKSELSKADLEFIKKRVAHYKLGIFLKSVGYDL